MLHKLIFTIRPGQFISCSSFFKLYLFENKWITLAKIRLTPDYAVLVDPLFGKPKRRKKENPSLPLAVERVVKRSKDRVSKLCEMRSGLVNYPKKPVT